MKVFRKIQFYFSTLVLLLFESLRFGDPFILCSVSLYIPNLPSFVWFLRVFLASQNSIFLLQMKVGKSLNAFPDSEFAEALGITGTYTGSTAPAGSLLHAKPRRLTPIEAPREGHVRTAWSTISSMTPTLSVIKHMSSASGKTDDSKSTQPNHIKTNVFEITREILEQNGRVLSHDINQNMKKWKEESGVHGN